MWLIFLPDAWFWGYYHQGGMLGLWIPLFIYRIGLAAIMYMIYRKRTWIHIKI